MISDIYTYIYIYIHIPIYIYLYERERKNEEKKSCGNIVELNELIARKIPSRIVSLFVPTLHIVAVNIYVYIIYIYIFFIYIYSIYTSRVCLRDVLEEFYFFVPTLHSSEAILRRFIHV